MLIKIRRYYFSRRFSFAKMVEATTQDLTPLFVTEADQEKPATNNNYVRLYGHHLCPFVEKARMALAARAVPY